MNYQARLGKLKEVPLGPKLAAYEPRAKSGLLLVFYKQSLIGTQAHPFVYLLSKTVFLTIDNCSMRLCPSEPQVETIRPFKEKFADHLRGWESTLS